MGKGQGIAEPVDVRPGDIDGWVSAAGGEFEECYRLMRSLTGLRPGPCFVAAWMALGKDDRGSLRTWGKLAEWLGVARQTVYGWRATHRLDEWAEQLRLMMLRGERLGEVDRVAYMQAIDPSAPVAARRLFYERVGVLGQDADLRSQAQESQMQAWLDALRKAGEE